MNEIKVTKTLSALKLVPIIHPGKFGGIPSTSSRIYYADADTNGIRTETNMSPLTFGGVTQSIKGFRKYEILQKKLFDMKILSPQS